MGCSMALLRYSKENKVEFFRLVVDVLVVLL